MEKHISFLESTGDFPSVPETFGCLSFFPSATFLIPQTAGAFLGYLQHNFLCLQYNFLERGLDEKLPEELIHHHEVTMPCSPPSFLVKAFKKKGRAKRRSGARFVRVAIIHFTTKLPFVLFVFSIDKAKNSNIEQQFAEKRGDLYHLRRLNCSCETFQLLTLELIFCFDQLYNIKWNLQLPSKYFVERDDLP